MDVSIGLSNDDLGADVRLLNRLLADEYVLYTKTRNFHWNVVGQQFHDLHHFFQGQYEKLDDVVDEVAERRRTLDGHAMDTLEEIKQQSTLAERPGVYPDVQGMVTELLADHESVIRWLRADIETAATIHKDAGASDFLTDLMSQHEKMAWMLATLGS